MNFFGNILKVFHNPKKKSLIYLALYVLFFLFAFAIINTSSNMGSSYNELENEKSELSALDNYKNMNSYKYEITFTINDMIDYVEGTYYNSTSLLTINGSKYYYENNLFYIIDGTSYHLSDVKYNILKFFNTNFYEILINSKLESSITYNDGTIENDYIIDSNYFYKYYFEQDSIYQNNITITVFEKDKYINKMILDLSNLNIDIKKIEIEYSNINNINSLEFNKDNLIRE